MKGNIIVRSVKKLYYKKADQKGKIKRKSNEPKRVKPHIPSSSRSRHGSSTDQIQIVDIQITQ